MPLPHTPPAYPVSAPHTPHRYVLTISCRDVRGIVAAVSGFLANAGGFIIESAQFGDASTEKFFLRIEFHMDTTADIHALRAKFAHDVATPFAMQWQWHDRQQKPRMAILVSKHGHCLYDLVHRVTTGLLPVEVAAVISNHDDLREFVQWHDIPFYHLPVTPNIKAQQEAQMLELLQREKVDLVVLARYMQILSGQMCESLHGRAINIHHSFLPSFKGANPYQQAFDRGVKLIGATAHYITPDLDEGPIIEQEVARVDHTATPEQLAATGRDIECSVLARAVQFHLQHRVLLNGHKTVVFR